MHKILRKRNTVYYAKLANYLIEEGSKMNTEIKELNRIICKECDEKAYEKCKNCRIYKLINRIAAAG
ncbi:MAG: hypothetical protein QMD13_07010 [Candidatus Bathyarchaeia archaeon]|nr:hypothetical protein [Candidatus Bathyarchaeia archaeon]